MCAARSLGDSFSNSASFRVSSFAPARINVGNTGHGMSSTSFGSSLFNPSP